MESRVTIDFIVFMYTQCQTALYHVTAASSEFFKFFLLFTPDFLRIAPLKTIYYRGVTLPFSMYLDNFIQHSKTKHLQRAEAPAAVTAFICAAKKQVAEHGMAPHGAMTCR